MLDAVRGRLGGYLEGRETLGARAKRRSRCFLANSPVPGTGQKSRKQVISDAIVHDMESRARGPPVQGLSIGEELQRCVLRDLSKVVIQREELVIP
jgi:hypothetical protein